MSWSMIRTMRSYASSAEREANVPDRRMRLGAVGWPFLGMGAAAVALVSLAACVGGGYTIYRNQLRGQASGLQAWPARAARIASMAGMWWSLVVAR